MATPYKCPICGLANSMGSTHCAACGVSLGAPKATPRPQPVIPPPLPPFPTPGASPTGTPATVTSSPAATQQQSSFWSWFGWKTLEGQVIHIDPLYMSRPEFSWLGFFAKFLLLLIAFLVVGPIVLGVVVAMTILSLLLSFLFPWCRSGGRGCFSSIACQVVGFFLTSKLLGPKADIPTRDVRVRDKSGQEHLVRIKGEIVAGNLNVGDEIITEGYNRHGTIMFRQGFNKRINCEIKVKRL